MILLGSKLNEKYAWELSLFHQLRTFTDGISFFEFVVNFDKYIGDHTPRFNTMLVILNCTIFEFFIYNMYHLDE